MRIIVVTLGLLTASLAVAAERVPVEGSPASDNVRFELPRLGERWALTDSSGLSLCNLPCAWGVTPDAHLRLLSTPLDGSHPLNLSVPDLTTGDRENPRYRALVVKNKTVAAAIGYGAVGGGMALVGGWVGQIVAGVLAGTRGPGIHCESAGNFVAAATCVIGSFIKLELATIGDSLKGYGIGLASGAVLGALVGTGIYLGWDPQKVVLVQDGP